MGTNAASVQATHGFSIAASGAASDLQLVDRPGLSGVRSTVNRSYVESDRLASVGALPPHEIPHGPRPLADELVCQGTACRAAWNGTDEASRANLGELVLALQLRQAVRDNDLTAMRDTVSSALASGVIGSPLFEQLVEFLERALAL